MAAPWSSAVDLDRKSTSLVTRIRIPGSCEFIDTVSCECHEIFLNRSGWTSAGPVNFRNRWDRHYGRATVQVHRSDRVTMTVEGFNDGALFDPQSGVISAVGAPAPYETLYAADLP